ncbi:CPBP family intramembrane glutamic endopeptidase [Enterococcus faecalis]|uniref:CPBP family intramembrane glutamic endopeptidase n=2 Tax=Enterococcus faecalis TaxID=1351 RepID=UPI001F510DA5|nr:type II CAAX endopeptidase family protein [Enterococcus faecalis]
MYGEQATREVIKIKEKVMNFIKKYDIGNKCEQINQKAYLTYTSLIVFFVYGIIADPRIAVTKNTTFFIIMFFSALSMVVLFYRRISPFKNVQPKKYVLTLITIGYLIETVVENGYNKILVAINGTSNTLNQEVLDNILKNNPEQHLQYFSVVSVLTPIGEEVLFRGTLLASILFLGKIFNVKSKCKEYICFLVITSVLFGFMHGFDNWLTPFVYVIAGLVYGGLYLYSKTIIVPIGIHILNNSVVSFSKGKDVNQLVVIVSLVVIAIMIETIMYSKNKQILLLRNKISGKKTDEKEKLMEFASDD